MTYLASQRRTCQKREKKVGAKGSKSEIRRVSNTIQPRMSHLSIGTKCYQASPFNFVFIQYIIAIVLIVFFLPFFLLKILSTILLNIFFSEKSTMN